MYLLYNLKNCYAAGEVGTLTTDPKKSANVGGFGGASSFNCTNCFYDKQTTAMAETTKPPTQSVPSTTPEA